MIKKTQHYKLYKKEIQYEDGGNFDFIGRIYLSFNEIIAKGTNFRHHIITNDNGVLHIEYAEIIEQDNKKTIMHTTFLTDYYNNDGIFELDAESYITFIHNKPLKQIKKEYKNDNNLYNYIKEILINNYGYKISYDDDNYKGYKALYEDEENIDDIKYAHNKEFEVYKDFQNAQKIGEVKNIINDESNRVKTLAKKLFKGNAYKGLCFTEKGATGTITVQCCIR